MLFAGDRDFLDTRQGLIALVHGKQTEHVQKTEMMIEHIVREKRGRQFVDFVRPAAVD